MYRATTTLDIPYIKEGLEKLMFGGIASAVVKAKQHQAALLNNITIKQHQSEQATATFRPKVCLRAAIVMPRSLWNFCVFESECWRKQPKHLQVCFNICFICCVHIDDMFVLVFNLVAVVVFDTFSCLLYKKSVTTQLSHNSYQYYLYKNTHSHTYIHKETERKIIE